MAAAFPVAAAAGGDVGAAAAGGDVEAAVGVAPTPCDSNGSFALKRPRCESFCTEVLKTTSELVTAAPAGATLAAGTDDPPGGVATVAVVASVVVDADVEPPLLSIPGSSIASTISRTTPSPPRISFCFFSFAFTSFARAISWLLLPQRGRCRRPAV